MKQHLSVLTLFSIVVINTLNSQDYSVKMDTIKNSSICTDECEADNKTTALSCKLTTQEMQKRKTTVITSLKNQVIEKKELRNGFAFKFTGTDEMLDELTEFIKTERECCSFFTFNLSISGDKREAWLELTGIDGVKEFIETELGF